MVPEPSVPVDPGLRHELSLRFEMVRRNTEIGGNFEISIWDENGYETNWNFQLVGVGRAITTRSFNTFIQEIQNNPKEVIIFIKIKNWNKN